jgi:hypothetical protein
MGISQNDLRLFIKSWEDCETELDVLISHQKIANEKLRLDLKAISLNYIFGKEVQLRNPTKAK